MPIRNVRNDDQDDAFEPELPAGPDGSALPLVRHKWNGARHLHVGQSLIPASEERAQPVRAPKIRSREEMRAIVRRILTRLMRRYRNEARCSERELRIMESLFKGLALREVARREERAPQRIGQIINGLALRAPEFYRWWTRKHFSRRMAARDRSFRARDHRRAMRCRPEMTCLDRHQKAMPLVTRLNRRRQK